MGYLYFSIAFMWCCFCICATFLFCLRALHLHKVEKLDPVNVVKTTKRVKEATAKKRLERDELLEQLLENG